MAIFPGAFIFRFREAEHIEEFLSHILSDDEVRILRTIAYFPLSRRLLNHEQHSVILQNNWMNKEQIAMLGIISRKKIYQSHDIFRDLIADSFILEWKKNTWGGYKSYFRLNLDIPLLQSYASSFLDCFQITTGFDWLLGYLNSKDECQEWLTKKLEASKVPTEAINSIIVGLTMNYKPAQKELIKILSKQGVSDTVINWLISKLSGSDDK